MKAVNWQFVVRISIRASSALALIMFLAWFISDRSLEAGAAFMSALIVFLGSFIGEGEAKEHPRDETLEQRNRRVILQHVENFWVKGVLENSLRGLVKIALDLEDTPEATTRPWDIAYATSDQTLHTLTPDGQVTDIFNRVGKGRSLLILGAPGSGKTTLLLELVREAIARAGDDPTEPIPVVLNLSSWASKAQPLVDWLAEELGTIYRVPKKISCAWIDNDKLFLLLDGLDEVARERREACIAAINAFRENHMMPVAVCSRSEEYEELGDQLALEGAIVVQPLARECVEQYLGEGGNQLAAIRDTLKIDETLWELLTTPLVLSVMIRAYQGVPGEAIPPGSIPERRKHLFDAYIARVFEHRPADVAFSPEQTRHWLAWLASQMQRHSQSIFLIERLQPSWLETDDQRRRYKIRTRLVFGLIFGLSNGLLGGLAFRSVFGLFVGLIFGLIGGLIFRPIVGWQNRIDTVDLLTWSWKKAKMGLISGLISGLVLGLFGGLISGLSGGLVSGLISGLVLGLFVGLSNGLLGGLLFGLRRGLVANQVPKTTIPNQGIKQSRRYSVYIVLVFLSFGLISGLFVGLISELSNGLFGGLSNGLIFGLLGGLPLGLFTGIRYGGAAVAQHFTLRRTLVKNGYLPCNRKLVGFLDYAVDLIFLRRVGGGWIFLHPLLMDHFADMWQEEVQAEG